jgi:hypothetical protein
VSSESASARPTPASSTLDRLELRVERLKLTFRFTYAFHAREVRFECDRGEGFTRVFPETFSFHANRHDPAELLLQLSDLASRPQLLSPSARRRDADVLISRLVLGVPRYLERVLDRLEEEQRLGEPRMSQVYQDVALIAQTTSRFAGDPSEEERGLRSATLHLRKILLRALLRLVDRRVDADYLAGYVDGSVDPVDPADDLSETGFFYTLEGEDQDAINRCLVRLAERAFYRWLEDGCLDESNGAFESEDSPFESRECEVRHAVAGVERELVERGRELTPFLRRPANRDCLRLLGKLEAWFLRQYDIHHAAVMIQHARDLSTGRADPDRVLSRHRTRNYVVALSAIAAPFAAAAVAYESAPRLFDAACAIELMIGSVAVLWFLLYRFLWLRDLTFFHASVPRIMAGIIVGYLPIFFIDEVWSLAHRSWFTLATIVVVLGSTTLLYLYIEVQRRIGDTDVAFARARQIFLLGVLQAAGIGLIFTGMVGRFMATRNWLPDSQVETVAELPPFIGQLPAVIGIDPFLTFPSAIFIMTFMSFFIGTFLQLMWEDLPITEPL